MSAEEILRVGDLPGGGKIKRLPFLTLLFAIAFGAFFTLPSLLSGQFWLYPLMKTGDFVDILTPLVLIPLYWLLYRLDPRKPLTLPEIFLFMVLATFWVEGQGMHLSANSISHLLKATRGDAYTLTFFYDEVLSHYLWHVGIVGLSALLFWRQWRNPLSQPVIVWPSILAGILYGLFFFTGVIEAGTAPLGISAAAFFTIFGGLRARDMKERPLIVFLLSAFTAATLFFIVWAIICSGLPQFSEIGLMK